MKARDIAEETGELAFLTWQAFAALFKPPYEIGLWVRQMEQIGVRSLGVASITTIFTGMVLALQTALSLPSLGVKYYIGTVVSKSLVRELGPVLIALIVGGRIGSGMTAEIGTMKVTEQIDALRAMAADPVKKLVVPKLAATLVMLPALTILGDALGILGGLVIVVTSSTCRPASTSTTSSARSTSATSGAESPSPFSSRSLSRSSDVTMGSIRRAARTAWAGRRPTPWCWRPSLSWCPTSFSPSSSTS